MADEFSQLVNLGSERLAQAIIEIRHVLEQFGLCATGGTSGTPRTQPTYERFSTQQHIRARTPDGWPSHIEIPSNAKGWSYTKIFGYYMDHRTNHFTIKDGSLGNEHGIRSFICFCELIRQKCAEQVDIYLYVDIDKEDLRGKLAIVKKSLEGHHIYIHILDSHSSEPSSLGIITINKTWKATLTEGLNIFSHQPTSFALGRYNSEFLKCKSCKIKFERLTRP